MPFDAKNNFMPLIQSIQHHFHHHTIDSHQCRNFREKFILKQMLYGMCSILRDAQFEKNVISGTVNICNKWICYGTVNEQKYLTHTQLQ